MVLGFGGIKSWKREESGFAQRVDVGEIKGFFRKGIVVEQGSKAMFIQDGKLSGVLLPGKYDAGGVVDRLKDANIFGSSTVILVDDSDVPLDLDIEDVITKESIRVGVKSRVTVQMEAPEIFLTNFMKGKDSVKIHDMTAALQDEMKMVVQSQIRDHSVDDIAGNLDLKKKLEQDFQYQMKTTLERYGIKLVQLNYVNFEFPEGVKKAQKVREEGYYKKAEAETEAEVDRMELGEAIGAKRKWDEYLHEKKLKDLDIDEKKMDMFSKTSLEAIIASTSDKDLQAHLADLKKQEMLKDMTEEQIMALAAMKSPEAAKAIAEKYKTVASEDRLKDHKEFLDKLERIARDASPKVMTGIGQPVVVSGTQQPEKVVICSNCGAENSVENNFCMKCDGKLGQ